MPNLIQLDSGERLESGQETTEGVLTDAGIIPWEWIDGFWSFHKASNRYMFVPIR